MKKKMKIKRYVKVCENPATWIQADIKKPKEQVIKEFHQKVGVVDNMFSRAISRLQIFNQNNKI